MLRNMSIIAGDENLLKRVNKYLRKLIAEKESTETLISKEDFFDSLDRGEELHRQGKTHVIESVGELRSFLNTL